LASIDNDGNLTIEGRTKDLIKSGGEWINPTETETIIGRLPGVGLVAVIGCSDAKWGERPVLVVEPRKGHVLDEKALLAALRGKVPDWWIPEQVPPRAIQARTECPPPCRASCVDSFYTKRK
jgi:fatty-acyl-CoA synthase